MICVSATVTTTYFVLTSFVGFKPPDYQLSSVDNDLLPRLQLCEEKFQDVSKKLEDAEDKLAKVGADKLLNPPKTGVVRFGEEAENTTMEELGFKADGPPVIWGKYETTTYLNVYPGYPTIRPQDEGILSSLANVYLSNPIGAMPPGTWIKVVDTPHKVKGGGYTYVEYELIVDDTLGR